MSQQPLSIRLYLFSNRCLSRLIMLVRACFIGLWLGVLRKETLHEIDRMYYDANKRMYCDERYNKRGLFGWEQSTIDQYFDGCRSLLVAAVGGGREVIALRKLGYEADGFECHPELVAFANELLSKEGLTPNVQCTPRDKCSSNGHVYDGLIVGWGGYMLIQGRHKRIEFLRNLRVQARDGAPILLSFFPRASSERRYFKIISLVGNVFRFLLRRERVELGDNLTPDYSHCFSEEEVAGELKRAGFELAFYSKKEYGHAVGIASGDPTVTQAETPLTGVSQSRPATAAIHP